MLLWTGWYGFNTTGAVHVGDEEWGSIVARVGVNTTLAPAMSAVVVCTVSWYHKRFVNVPATVRESQRVCV
jgi:ammonia channel protein AmtB